MSKKVSVGWRCPTNEAGEGFGFNESGMEHFAGDPFSAIAREITQNTNDAKKSNPAYLVFRLVNVPIDQFPNRDEFVNILGKCRTASEGESQKAVTFFDNALKKIEGGNISFLVARDRNTTGIQGPCKRGTPYHAFMKSTGTSRKDNADSGGSFGIGKNAPFAISDFRTVFVLTNYMGTDGNIEQLAQGKSILVSHGNDGTEFTNNAYWGSKDDFGPLNADGPSIPGWMKDPFADGIDEVQLGTSIFIAGFRSNSKWDKIITAYIIQNFFAAIEQKDLVIEVGKYVISHETIADLFADSAIEEAVSDFPNQPEGLQHSRFYFECMNSQETIHETSQQSHLKKTAVGILIGDNYPKKVAFIRNGMLITDHLYRLQRFPGMKNFVAVVQCQSIVGNELLKQMEPPRHNEFQPERLATEEERKRGRIALRQLADFVRKHLNEHAKNPVVEEVNLDELSDLLGSDAIGTDPNKDGEMNPTGKVTIAARPKPNRNAGKNAENNSKGLGQGFEGIGTGGDLDKGQGSGTGAKPAGIGNKDGVGTGENPGDEGDDAGEKKGNDQKIATPLSLNNVRGVRLGSRERRISFTSPRDGKVHLSFQRVGVDMNTSLNVTSVSTGNKIDPTTVELDVKKMTKIKFEVTFAEDFNGAVKVIANAI
jgi:hypothetical protein